MAFNLKKSLSYLKDIIMLESTQDVYWHAYKYNFKSFFNLLAIFLVSINTFEI